MRVDREDWTPDAKAKPGSPWCVSVLRVCASWERRDGSPASRDGLFVGMAFRTGYRLIAADDCAARPAYKIRPGTRLGVARIFAPRSSPPLFSVLYSDLRPRPGA
jgi:hypothetical protein